MKRRLGLLGGRILASGAAFWHQRTAVRWPFSGVPIQAMIAWWSSARQRATLAPSQRGLFLISSMNEAAVPGPPRPHFSFYALRCRHATNKNSQSPMGYSTSIHIAARAATHSALSRLGSGIVFMASRRTARTRLDRRRQSARSSRARRRASKSKRLQVKEPSPWPRLRANLKRRPTAQ